MLNRNRIFFKFFYLVTKQLFTTLDNQIDISH